MKTLYHWNFTSDMPFDFDIQFFPSPDFYPVMDFHNPIHLNLILDQGMAGKVGNTLFQLSRYDLQITSPWELHGENQIDQNLRLLSITVDPDILPVTCSNIAKRRCLCSCWILRRDIKS